MEFNTPSAPNLSDMGVSDDDLTALVDDLGITREALLVSTRERLADLGGTIRDMARDLRADAWRAADLDPRRRENAVELARELGDVAREHMSVVAVLVALGEAFVLDGDADSSLLDARLDAALGRMERAADADARSAVQTTLDRIDRYAVAVSVKVGRPIPARPERMV